MSRALNVSAIVVALAGGALVSSIAAQAPAKPPASAAKSPQAPAAAPAPAAKLPSKPAAPAPAATTPAANVPSATPPPPPAQPKNDYKKSSAWLCRPGRKDACSVDLTTTVVAKDGTLTREKWSAERKPAVDCFYVYPTVSADQAGNSDMKAGPEEKNVILHQLARFGSRCRLFAPLYRQVTVTSRRANIAGKPIPTDRELAYNDIVDAWNDYLVRDNKGRGVILIGHSQGAGVLAELIAKQIEGKPVQAQIVSALLIGGRVTVPKGGAIVGGTFKQMPLCRTNGQTGCIVSYASFRANMPPPANSRFGKAPEGQVAACTNPAALAGGSGELHAYLAAKASSTGVTLPPQPWASAKKVATNFASVPGLLTGECVSNANGSYLAVTVHGDPQDPRVDDIVGDIVRDGQVQADWGLHMIDVNLAMGNLVELVGQQTASYLAKTAPAAAAKP